MTRTLALLAFLAGCLQVPPAPHGMCSTAADCSAGEDCQEGVCWGDPPMGTFAATLGPPSDRTDLVATELPSLAIPQNGWLDTLTMPAPATLSGRVEAYCGATASCDGTTSVGATITITRRSLFTGGPGFRGVFASKDGLARGTDSFTATVPASQAGDPQYVVTIVPDGRGDQPPSTGTTPAMIAPPLRQTIPSITGTTAMGFTLGSASAKRVTVMLQDASQHPLTSYRVVALGRWDASSPLTEVSTVAYVGAASGGVATLVLADNIQPAIEIEAKSYDTLSIAPTLYGNLTLDATSPTSSITLVQPASDGEVDLSIPIIGTASDGSTKPVSGAHVILSSTYDPRQTIGTRAVLSAEAVTGDDGIAHLSVLGGAAFTPNYTISVVPPASSPFGVKYAEAYDITGSAKIPLPTRFALRGVIVDTSGNPLGNVSVTATPTLRFTWTLDPAAQEFLAEIPAATTITPDDGGFVVWVDSQITDRYASYDLAFAPAMGSQAPSWSQTGIDLSPSAGDNLPSLSLGQVTIPDASYVHGRIADSGDDVVQGGELRIYELPPDSDLCNLVANPPPGCTIPAQLMGYGTSDDQGIARLSLPRP